MNILEGRCCLKARVKINAGTHGVLKVLNFLGIVRTDAPTEYKRSVSLVGLEYRPVELGAVTTHQFRFSIEEEVVNDSLVLCCLCQVLSVGDVQRLDDGDGMVTALGTKGWI